MTKLEEIELNRLTPRLWELAKSNNLSKSCVYYRIYYMGMTPREACTTKKGGTTKHSRYIKIAEKNGIRRNMYYERIYKQKMSQEDACTIKPREKRIDTEEFIKSRKELGICYSTFNQRVRRGWSVREASTTPVKKAHRRRDL